MRVHASLKQTTFKNVKTETAHPFFCNPWQIYFSPAGHSPWHRRWHPVRSWGHGRSCSPSSGYFCPGNFRGWSSTPWKKAHHKGTYCIVRWYIVISIYGIWTYKNAKKLSFWIVSTKNPKELWRGVFSLASIYHLSPDFKAFLGSLCSCVDPVLHRIPILDASVFLKATRGDSCKLHFSMWEAFS